MKTNEPTISMRQDLDQTLDNNDIIQALQKIMNLPPYLQSLTIELRLDKKPIITTTSLVEKLR